MDAALTSTLEALLDPARVRWSRQRAALGEEPGEGELFLGAGSRDASAPPHPRMLLWKLPQWRAQKLRSTTEVVLRSAAVLDGLTLPLTFRLHDPTLDCVAAAALATYRVLHHRWPEHHEALAEYVGEWEQGRTERAGAYERALAAVYYAALHAFPGEDGAPSRELAALVLGALGLHAAALRELPTELISNRVARRLKADADLYRAELSRAWQVQLDLPVELQPQAYRRVDALFLSSPQDVTVLKLLARPDAEASFYGRGFELLAVHAPNEPAAWGRHTLSIAPESPGTLGDLALQLDRLEGDLAVDGTPRVKGTPRFTDQPPELEGLADPWYSDGYAWTKRRSTIVAPPFAGTRLSREQIWEATWQRFHVGRNIHVTASRAVFCRAYRRHGSVDGVALAAAGWRPMETPSAQHGFLPSVAESFLGGDVTHFEKLAGEVTVHLSVYPSELALVWVELADATPRTLLEVATAQAARLADGSLERLDALQDLGTLLTPIENSRWQVFGAYRINRARSTMLDGSRSVQGLFQAVASGEAPTLQQLPSDAEVAARRVQAARDVEHWFTPTGGARFELRLDDASEAPALDQDFALFLVTLGQRASAFELTRRMGEVERAARESQWKSLAPTRTLRGDVMLFRNSLWYARVSDQPELNARYDAWRELHGMAATVDALRDQTTELDEYRKERFENLVGVMLFLFLPITIVSGFFSGAQFNELELRAGLPWSTTGWVLFWAYTAFFSALVFGAVLVLRLRSSRQR